MFSLYIKNNLSSLLHGYLVTFVPPDDSRSVTFIFPEIILKGKMRDYREQG